MFSGSIYVGYVVYNSLFFNRRLLLVHLLESDEFTFFFGIKGTIFFNL